MNAGTRVTVYPTASEYLARVGATAIIVRELGDDERDLEEVGRMFTVRFEDESSLDVFEDELTAQTSDVTRKAGSSS
jgi:hypothetical protein